MVFVHRGLGPFYGTIQLVVFLFINIAFSEDYSTWKYSRTFTVNTTSTGANIAGTVYNFPLLLRLNPGIFTYFSETAPKGSDIRFAKIDGTPLAYEIERWVDNAKDDDTAEIWITIDTLYGNSTTQRFKMFWGKSGAADSSHGMLVFGSSNGFCATYHLAGTLDDASSNGNDGTASGDTTSTMENGIIGQARYFNGASYFHAGDLPDRPHGTVSFWFKPKTTFNSSATVTQGFWGKTVGESYNATISLRGSDFNYGGSGSTGAIQTKIENNNTSAYNHSTTGSFSAGTWYYIALRWGDNNSAMYVNGTLEHQLDSCKTVTGDAYDEIGRAVYDPANFSGIGDNIRYFTGILDEFRIDNTSRNGNWIRLCYENQKTSQKLISIVDTLKELIVTEPNDTVVPVGGTAFFTIAAEGAGNISYHWIRNSSDQAGIWATCTLSSVSPADTNAQFRCIVHDDYGTDSSRWAKLTVIDTPRIISQPSTITVTVGDNATFTLTVKDTMRITYSWRKTGNETVLGTAASFTLEKVTYGDSGDYYCILTNPAGTVSSEVARCKVENDIPDITSQPTGLTVTTGDDATFSLTVRDTTHLTYSWRKTGDETVLGTAASFTLSDIALGDSGDYYCSVSNSAGTVISQTARLTVEKRNPLIPRALFTLAPKSGLTPLEVKFTDASTGEITSRFWTFGDNSSSTETSPTHTYTETGSYSVTLIVAGPSGADTLVKIDSVRVLGQNIPLTNSVVIDTVYFDSINASIRVSWHIDSAALSYYPEAGITYSFIKNQTNPVGTNTVSIVSRSTDATVRLLEPIHFGATYYIALWFRLGSGEWLEPTAHSRKEVWIGSPYRETVTFFDPGKTNDTITAFNGSIILRKDASYTTSKTITDTLEIITPTVVPEGLIPVGIPFIFRRGSTTLPFYVGIRFDTLPAGSSPADVRIYSDSIGKYYVDFATVVDSVNKIAYVKTGNLKRSFIAMVDTSPPRVTIYATGAPLVLPAMEMKDSIGIVDNIANVRWRYLYGSGGEIPILHDQGDMSTVQSNLSLTIADASQAISTVTGLRVLFIVNDGRHTDTVNLSRNTYTATSDSMTTNANQWQPLFATAVLDHKEADSLIAQLLRYNDIDAYDNRYLRFYRWFNESDTAMTTDKWIEYDPESKQNRSLFVLEPGRLFWLKTWMNIPLHLTSGHSLPLNDTFTVDLPPRQWTDLGMPYRFDVRMEEILSATGTNADALQVYRWQQDASNNLYVLEPYFVPGMSDMVDRSKTIDHRAKSGYSFYNDHTETVTLRIPPVPVVMTSLAKKKTTTDTPSWNASCWGTRFITQTNDTTRFSTVYFGYAPLTNRHYPLTPSFLSVRMAVIDRTTSEQSSHYISAAAKNGLVKELLITNGSDSLQNFRYHFEQVGAFPDNFTAYCYDATTRKSDTSGTISIAPRSAVSRWIVIGDATYQQQFSSTIAPQYFILHPIFPNPSRSGITIRYSVPFGAKERISIAIYNTLGKKLWEKRTTRLLSEGFHATTWNGLDANGIPAGSGLYIVRFTVENNLGNAVSRFERHVTLLR